MILKIFCWSWLTHWILLRRWKTFWGSCSADLHGLSIYSNIYSSWYKKIHNRSTATATRPSSRKKPKTQIATLAFHNSPKKTIVCRTLPEIVRTILKTLHINLAPWNNKSPMKTTLATTANRKLTSRREGPSGTKTQLLHPKRTTWSAPKSKSLPTLITRIRILCSLTPNFWI